MRVGASGNCSKSAPARAAHRCASAPGGGVAAAWPGWAACPVVPREKGSPRTNTRRTVPHKVLCAKSRRCMVTADSSANGAAPHARRPSQRSPKGGVIERHLMQRRFEHFSLRERLTTRRILAGSHPDVADHDLPLVAGVDAGRHTPTEHPQLNRRRRRLQKNCGPRRAPEIRAG